MTVETVKAVQTCDVLFSLQGDPAVTRELARLCPRVEDLATLYQDKKLDLEVYRRIVDRVTAALRPGRATGVVFQGHPLLYCNPAQMLIRHCEQNDVELKILSGVSSLDTIFTALKIDIGATGLQILDVNRMVLYRQKPSTETPCLIFQVGSFGSAMITRGLRNRAERFAPLQRYLSRLYPAGHELKLVDCSTTSGFPDRVLSFPLSRLSAMAGEIDYTSTLYVPATRPPSGLDRAFLARLKSPATAARVAAGGRC